ncbi:hypothetical protein BSFA1_02150 [Burkholderia sp. SFA1]|nr:hypothetical protein BSFA1_02150 [Burkholderia sp. SFA1]
MDRAEPGAVPYVRASADGRVNSQSGSRGVRKDAPRAESKESMAPNPQKRRTPEDIRAGNKRLGIIMMLIAAVFFLGIVVRQYLLSRG